MKLTPSQKIAIQTLGKNLLVSAGAGSGKTRVLVERFLNLVTGGKALVTEILALTFTEKAANQMKSRILKAFKEQRLEGARRDLESSTISTIHSFASRLLKEHPLEAGVDPDFTVIESEEAELLKEQAFEEAVETGCAAGEGNQGGTFQLLKVYGEKNIRQGVFKYIFQAARTEGKSLRQFFEEARARRASEIPAFEEKCRQRIPKLLEKLDEKELAAEWERFSGRPENWDWALVEEFKEWFRPFSRRGGKKSREEWREITRLAREFLAAKFDFFAGPWRERFEELVLDFEARYEARKAENGFLDFDDLQIKVLGLFKKEAPACRKLLERYRKHFKFILVDEFQDTNPLQIELIRLLSSGDNLFQVGDYKQSIYGFRGAEPAYFLETEKSYSEEKTGVSVSLLENFRSAPPVLDFINRFFKHLWSDTPAVFKELTVGEKEKAEDASSIQPLVQIAAIEMKEEESLAHARMQEASWIAARIQQFHEEENIEYGDMAVLFQAMTTVGIYEQALKKAGVPYFVVAGRGFYHQPEVRDMMSFLACLENPLFDVPLAATLRSPFFQLSDDALFWLARYAKQDDEMRPLYRGVKNFEVISEISEEEKEKLRFFTRLMNELLAEKDRSRVAELLDKILAKTSFELNVLADRQGRRRFANLRKLTDLAREYEAREIMPLGDFIRTIRNLQTRDVRESEAQVEAEKSGRVVQLMSIHQAKGLEFPVVFVADLAHQKQKSESAAFRAEPGFGYDLQVRNDGTLDWERPFLHLKLTERAGERETEESKRLFYVAMTRAERRLLLSGVHQLRKTEKSDLDDMSRWMDWIMHSAGKLTVPIEFPERESSFAGRPSLAIAEKKVFEHLLDGDLPAGADTVAEEVLQKIAPRPKVFSRSMDLPVSAYAAYKKDPRHWRRVYEIGYPDKADFEGEAYLNTDEEEVEPADFGTAMHRLLERLDFRNPGRNLGVLVTECFREMGPERMEEAKMLAEKFIGSRFFKRIQTAKSLYRELPFVLNGRHGLVHGVLDLLFQDTEGGWHIVDYKTAEGDPARMRKAGYDLQVQIYGLATAELLGITPVAGWVYFLKNQQECGIPFTKEALARFRETFHAAQDEILEYSHAENAREFNS